MNNDNTGVSFIYHPDYYCDIGAHVFPMEKFRLLYTRLKEEGEIEKTTFFTPEPATREMLAAVHTAEYLDDLDHLRKTPDILSSELPISKEIIDAYKLAAGGTSLACEKALLNGCSINLTGGFHHAFADRAEGFCYLNDIAVGIRHIQKKEGLTRALVVDCDLHQGNGTAKIFQNDPDVFTFSIHQEHLYPLKQKSDTDIGLDFFTEDTTYLEHLRSTIPDIAERVNPELLIYVAGADPFEYDQLGNLTLSKKGLSERDMFIFTLAHENSIPVVSLLAGGYAVNINDTIDIHFRMCMNAVQVFG
jgi:acetoin utilization deacetylase AcuC-like enzyme